MDAKRPALPFVLTANDLLSGYSVYHDGAGWVVRLADALVAQDPDTAERLYATGIAELDRGAIVDPYLSGVNVHADGSIEPRHFRDRYRLSGPTIAFAGPAFAPGAE